MVRKNKTSWNVVYLNVLCLLWIQWNKEWAIMKTKMQTEINKIEKWSVWQLYVAFFCYSLVFVKSLEQKHKPLLTLILINPYQSCHVTIITPFIFVTSSNTNFIALHFIARWLIGKWFECSVPAALKLCPETKSQQCKCLYLLIFSFSSSCSSSRPSSPFHPYHRLSPKVFSKERESVWLQGPHITSLCCVRCTSGLGSCNSELGHLWPPRIQAKQAQDNVETSKETFVLFAPLNQKKPHFDIYALFT